ncbi:MAG: alpha/beta fold hydrolase [Alphaproteobacteria bacterium]|nr:alpha/beta fold hydrolase [Alphaproteobacteria bacterium]
MTPTVPALEERFREPPGWRWHHFTRNGRKIRFGSVFPKDSIPDAVIVCFPGVGEFAEKYFETARDFLNANMAFWTMDWYGQGASGRYLPNPQKRHGGPFTEDVADMHYFILEYIKHSSVHPDRGRIPMALLAHSMGSNIALHFLAKYPGLFECAGFTAPLIGIKAFERTPAMLAHLATAVCGALMGTQYVPGGDDWTVERHAPEGPKRLSGDPVRGNVHNLWCEANPALKVGDVTYGWLKHAQKSCVLLQQPAVYQAIQTPCFFGIAEHDHLVDNGKARAVIQNMKKASFMDIPGSHHEILMDSEPVRSVFMDGFFKLVKETILDRPETLKPF